MVNLFNGNLVKSVSLINVRTVGLPLSFKLTYNSQETVLGAVGNKWRHNFMASLDVSGGSATFHDIDGAYFSFGWNGSAWVLTSTSPFTQATLSEVGSTWQLVYPDNSAYYFNAKRRADQHHRHLRQCYNADVHQWRADQHFGAYGAQHHARLHGVSTHLGDRSARQSVDAGV